MATVSDSVQCDKGWKRVIHGRYPNTVVTIRYPSTVVTIRYPNTVVSIRYPRRRACQWWRARWPLDTTPPPSASGSAGLPTEWAPTYPSWRASTARTSGSTPMGWICARSLYVCTPIHCTAICTRSLYVCTAILCAAICSRFVLLFLSFICYIITYIRVRKKCIQIILLQNIYEQMITVQFFVFH